MTKKQVLEHAQRAEQRIREKKPPQALTELGLVKQGVSELREPAPSAPQPDEGGDGAGAGSSSFAPDLCYLTQQSQLPQKPGTPMQQPLDGSITWKSDRVTFATSDTTGISISGNPRDEIIGPSFKPGDEFWWGGWFSVGPFTIANPSGAFWVLTQLFGSPFEGSPPVKIELLDGGTKLGWQRNKAGGFEVMWTRPFEVGRKYTFLQHIKINETLGAPGLVEHWLNGEKVESANVPIFEASTRDGLLQPRLTSYRRKGMVTGTVEVDHGFMALGTRPELVIYPR